MAVEAPPTRTGSEIGLQAPSVVLRFRTTLPDVVLFFRGSAEHFFSLEMHNGNILAMVESENSKLVDQLPGKFNDGLWHNVSVFVNEELALTLDDTRNKEVKGGGRNRLLFFPSHGLEKVYIGGVPQEYLDKTKTRKGFIGCMEDLLIDGKPVLPQNFPPDDIQLGCKKTEWCHSNPCSQQGHCVDLWTEYRCDCYRPFYGEVCTHGKFSSYR